MLANTQKRLLGVFFILLAMTLALGISSYKSINLLSEHTKLIYQHPYVVSNHVNKINAQILAIHRELKDLILARQSEEVAKRIINIKRIEKKVLGYFDIIHEHYLGDKNKILAIKNKFASLGKLREQIIELKIAGKPEEALFLMKKDNVYYADILLIELTKFSEFADNKAKTFFIAAQEEADKEIHYLILAILIILLGGIYLAIQTSRNINILIHRIRKHAKLMNEKNREVENLINSITDWIWVVDENARYTYISKQVKDQLGYNPEELIGKTPFDLMDEEEAKRVSMLFEEIVNERKPLLQLRNVNRHKEGYEVVIESSGNPIFDDKGVFRGYQGSDRDVTKAHQLQKAIKDQESMLLSQSRLAQMGELVSMIAHQWRQPLSTISAISAEVEIMLEINNYDLAHAAQQKECLTFLGTKHKKIQEQVQHLSQTINDFRDFYKPNQQPHKENINKSITKALRILEPMFKTQSITIKTDFKAKEEHTIFAGRIVQTLVNILKNAVDAFSEQSIPSPRINIKSSETQGETVLTITDNAGGIDSKILDKIFDPYFSTKDEKNGTGLGLYMSKIIIQKHHNGTIRAENTDSGIRFVIELPHIQR